MLPLKPLPWKPSPQPGVSRLALLQGGEQTLVQLHNTTDTHSHWMSPKNMLNKRSQIQWTKYCMIPCVWCSNTGKAINGDGKHNTVHVKLCPVQYKVHKVERKGYTKNTRPILQNTRETHSYRSNLLTAPWLSITQVRLGCLLVNLRLHKLKTHHVLQKESLPPTPNSHMWPMKRHEEQSCLPV